MTDFGTVAGIQDVRRSFTFKSNPGFIFHGSPGLEAGGEEELKASRHAVECRFYSSTHI